MLRNLMPDADAASSGVAHEDTSSEPGDFARLFLIRTARRLHFVEERNIEWIEAAANYSQFHLDGIVHTARETIRSVEARLTPGLFARVHRSAIVNVTCIRAFERTPAGDYVITLKSGARVPVSRAQRRTVKSLLSSLLHRDTQPHSLE